MTTTESNFAETLAELLNEKFKEAGKYATHVFGVDKGRKYDRVWQRQTDGSSQSVHCFVEAATGHVFKAAGWKAPAKGVRFTSVQEAAENADLHGGYLYLR